MNYALVKIVLNGIAASPKDADSGELDEAIAWVRARIVIRGRDKGPVREVRPEGFESAVGEMEELRRLLSVGDLAEATAAAGRALALLG
jgi:hypothetical protein